MKEGNTMRLKRIKIPKELLCAPFDNKDDFHICMTCGETHKFMTAYHRRADFVAPTNIHGQIDYTQEKVVDESGEELDELYCACGKHSNTSYVAELSYDDYWLVLWEHVDKKWHWHREGLPFELRNNKIGKYLGARAL